MKFQHKAFFKKFKAHIPQFIFFLFIVNVVISIFFLVAFAVNFFSIWRSQILFYIVGMGIGMLGIFIFYWAVMKGTTTIQKWGFGIGSFLIPILVFLISFSLINNPFDHLRLNAFVSGMLPLTFLYISMFFSFIGGLFIFSIYHYITRKEKFFNFNKSKSVQLIGLVFSIILLPGPIWMATEFTSDHLRYVDMESNDPYKFEPGLTNKIDLFVSGEDGYYTYRIPSLLSLPKDTLLAFCEARKYSSGDHGKVDLVMKRSSDGGITWSPQQIIWSNGFRYDNWNTVGNPCPVYDNTTDTVFLPFNINNALCFMMNSTDLGKTWGDPVNITSIANPNWRIWDGEKQVWERNWHAFGPGHGISLQWGSFQGRLIIPSYGGMGRSHALYSDDHGNTWKLSTNDSGDGGECEAVELLNESVYFTLRNNDGRLKSISNDGATTMGASIIEKGLPGPPCMSSICRQSDNITGSENCIVFSGPDGKERNNLTIRMTKDETLTWPYSRILYRGPAAYSDMQVLDDGTICCLLERGQKDPYQFISFVQFSYEWVET